MNMRVSYRSQKRTGEEKTELTTTNTKRTTATLATLETVGIRTSKWNLYARAILSREGDAPSSKGASTMVVAIIGGLIKVASSLQLNSNSIQSML